MKIGLFGGSFDPIHVGHLMTAQSVIEKRNLDKIIFMPCYISPHKLDNFYIEAKHRFNMIKLAIDGTDYFTVSDFEINRPQISFTIDTVLELKKIYQEIELIIGYDNLLVFDKWKEPDLLVQNVKLLVMKRKTNDDSTKKNKFFEHAIFIDTPTIEISSTEVRSRIKAGLDAKFMLGEKVQDYIIKNNLYK
ncbi:MAG: nicotinate (nicotinamide) nucleotide adenylyltransferase [Ignavibacteriales bacterium CG_4_9_14_3_um_filter_34_10]|nr:MAG: nicotinate (nicotinamide) nucleotide adenylyltransferase [Ignavibacteriales bacterium CG_4_9_14_3_um_filter_34_10]